MQRWCSGAPVPSCSAITCLVELVTMPPPRTVARCFRFGSRPLVASTSFHCARARSGCKNVVFSRDYPKPSSDLVQPNDRERRRSWVEFNTLRSVRCRSVPTTSRHTPGRPLLCSSAWFLDRHTPSNANRSALRVQPFPPSVSEGDDQLARSGDWANQVAYSTAQSDLPLRNGVSLYGGVYLLALVHGVTPGSVLDHRQCRRLPRGERIRNIHEAHALAFWGTTTARSHARWRPSRARNPPLLQTRCGRATTRDGQRPRRSLLAKRQTRTG